MAIDLSQIMISIAKAVDDGISELKKSGTPIMLDEMEITLKFSADIEPEVLQPVVKGEGPPSQYFTQLVPLRFSRIESAPKESPEQVNCEIRALLVHSDEE
ncbi:hypothetical protein ES703_117695 [subsurface metagenome]